MRIGSVVGVCAVLGLGLAGCSSLSDPRSVSTPPSELALEKNILTVARSVKWVGLVEASPVRQAHLTSPADWVVCAQSGARDLSPPYALFFNGDSLVHYRIAVQVDECGRMPFAPIGAVEPQVTTPLAIVPTR